MNTDTLTKADKLALGRITTRDEAGKHFTEEYPADWLAQMEQLGFLTIDRSVHETGIPYAQEYWSVEVSPDVAGWFDSYGKLMEG